MSTNWQNYEEVALHILTKIKDHLDLCTIEGKQKLKGLSGTHWEIDAKGVRQDDESIVLIECRKRGKRIDQEQMAALAYRIRDTGANGGIIVSPLKPQKGAAIVATSENIKCIQIDPGSDTTNYIARFLRTIFTGITETSGLNFSVTGSLTPSDDEQTTKEK